MQRHVSTVLLLPYESRKGSVEKPLPVAPCIRGKCRKVAFVVTERDQLCDKTSKVFPRGEPSHKQKVKRGSSLFVSVKIAVPPEADLRSKRCFSFHCAFDTGFFRPASAARDLPSALQAVRDKRKRDGKRGKIGKKHPFSPSAGLGQRKLRKP